MEADKIEIPDAFFCPITHEIMTDPVMDNEGNTYERAAITEWLGRESTSPVTRKPLQISDLRPNRALKDSIEAIKAKGVDLTDKRAPAPQQVQPAPPAQSVPSAQPAPPAQPDDSAGDIDIKIIAEPGYALVSLIPPKGIERTPTDIVCVIDVSGSMDATASIKDDTGKVENDGLTVLDIVKHAVKTIITSLGDKDRLALVAFADSAQVVLELTPMDRNGKATAVASVDNLHTLGSTNLWDGLQTGLETLRNKAIPGKNSAVLLLTDGVPNIVPPRGHLPMLEMYKDKHGLPGQIMTFGFGYQLDSRLLVDLAVAGKGSYAFIPDSSFTGTVFIHALTRLLTTCATQLVLSLETENSSRITKVLGESATNASWGMEVQFGSMLYGQSRDLILEMEIPQPSQPFLRATLKYRDLTTGKMVERSASGGPFGPSDLIEEHRLRLGAVETIRKALTLLPYSRNNPPSSSSYSEAQQAMSLFTESLKSSKIFKEKKMEDLYQDLSGQATEAISSSSFYMKWGAHYLPSLIGAHLDQVCNNFKDPGVQHYVGSLFKEIRDTLDDAFLKLPPPKPSRRVGGGGGAGGGAGGAGGGGGVATAAAPVSMSKYYNRRGPCFSGSSLVQMADGSSKRCDEIQKGDLVKTPNGQATVRCVLKTVSSSGLFDLCLLPSGLLITPYHPIREEKEEGGKWRFPIDIAEPKTLPCPSIFSFLLDRDHIMIIDKVQCVALAHHFQEKVVAHPYFGTEEVVKDMEEMRGFQEGLILLQTGCLEEDPKTGLVRRLIQGPVPEATPLALESRKLF